MDTWLDTPGFSADPGVAQKHADKFEDQSEFAFRIYPVAITNTTAESEEFIRSRSSIGLITMAELPD